MYTAVLKEQRTKKKKQSLLPVEAVVPRMFQICKRWCTATFSNLSRITLDRDFGDIGFKLARHQTNHLMSVCSCG